MIQFKFLLIPKLLLNSAVSTSEAATVLPTVKSEETQQDVEKPKETKLNIESIATVARASSDGPSIPSSDAIGHIIDTVSQMVDSDIRTPPKLKEIIKEKSNENRRDALGEVSTPLPYTFVYDEEVSKFDENTDKTLLTDSSEGKASHVNMKVATDEGVKGIAIPVVMDDINEPAPPPKKLQKIPEVPKPVKDVKKNTVKTYATTTPSSGLSTWILLSDNRDSTTPSPKKNNSKKENEEKKKAAAATSTTKKPTKIQATTSKSTTTQNNKKGNGKPSNGNGKKPENESMSALEAMVKNQKKSITTTQKPKTNEEVKQTSQKKPTDTKKKTNDKLETAETKDKVEIELPESKTSHTLPTNLPIMVDEKGVTVSTDQNSSSTTESSVEGTTKKKTTSKKKKKNKNRRRKPANDTGVEAKIPQPAVGSQIYNFISREIVPTVGLGLIGVALTAGLASFLGYNPFVSTTAPLRRTYESHHGYSPSNYYSYNTEYTDGGQSEEALFREVLSGMPEDSRYGMTQSDYPEAYNRKDTQQNPAYSSGNVYNSQKDSANYDASYPQDYSSAYGATYDTQDKKYGNDAQEKYPVYSRETGTSFVYPETTGMNAADTSRVSDQATQTSTNDKYKTNSDTIERQPEALYRVAGETELQYRNGDSTIKGMNSQSSWHRIGSPMDIKKPYPHLEPGPRSLDLNKESIKTEKKRVKRGTESVIQRISRKRTKKENDVENEIDFDDSISDNKVAEQIFEDFSSTTAATKTTTYSPETTTVTKEIDFLTTSTEYVKPFTSTEDVRDASTFEPTDSYETDSDSTSPVSSSALSVLDVLKRLAQFKLRLGLSFLRSTTDMFSRYLDDIQRKVDESFINATTTQVQYNRRKSPWSRIFSRLGDSYRKKRSVLKENQFLTAMFTEDDKTNERLSKSTKKELSQSNKIFHQKKTSPKKYDSKRTN